MGFGGPAGVVRAAGLHASRLDGSPLIYNRRDPYLPDLLMCRAELADACSTLTGDRMDRPCHEARHHRRR